MNLLKIKLSEEMENRPHENAPKDIQEIFIFGFAVGIFHLVPVKQHSLFDVKRATEAGGNSHVFSTTKDQNLPN
jgi:hypothetical protein